MRSFSCFFLVLLLGVLWAGHAAAGPNMQEGLWEVTSTMEMPGMPMKMPATTFQKCVTEEDLVPQAEQPGQECRMDEQEVSGDTVTWKVVCETGEGTVTSRGRIVYAGNGFEGTIVSSGPQFPGEMTQAMTGRRLGDCR